MQNIEGFSLIHRRFLEISKLLVFILWLSGLLLSQFPLVQH